MDSHKDKRERILSGCYGGVLDLFSLLESSDPSEVESVKNVIHENLSTAKDSRLLNCIVDYYMTLHSERSLEILVRLKDPHDKHLFDKINELIKSENTCYQSLQLLCNLVYRQPSWIYRIAHHRLMHSLFHLLKNDVNASNLISALLIIICLLPMIPSQFGPFLSDTFNVFSRLIAWNVKKPSAISETYILHLQVSIYSLFHRLYGMFPCNFLAYLRSYYGGRDYSEENFRIFSVFIKPMLERVRLHPLLVTASKETELSISRWKKMEYHDVITECALVSLDAIEGTLEGLRGRNQNINSAPKRHASLCAQNSLQYASLSSQGSVTSASVEPNSLVNEALSSYRDSLCSTTSSLINKTNNEAKNLSSQISSEENMPLDFAVEAKPEEFKEEKHTSKQKLSKLPSKDTKFDLKASNEESDKILPVPTTEDLSKIVEKGSALELLQSNIEKCILQGIEAKEEEIDKEVSELTSSENKSTDENSPGEERHDTPFCSTTQNLTDEPPNLATCSVLSSEMLTKSHDEDVDEMYSSMQDAEEEVYVPSSFSRFRYLSHCGPAPVPSDSIKKPKVARSISCPANFCSTSQSLSVSDTDNVSANNSKSDVVVTCSNSVITTASAFVISNNANLTTSRNSTYEHLLPMAMEPLPNIYQPSNSSVESNYNSYNNLFTSLSPPELLDNYIQLGSETYMTQIASIPITSTKSTDWTHFGGKPPPDEIDILRKQILLLHNQLLFERHRKDIHSERIRRILGRAKKSKMQEELIVALKEQINLLEKDNEDLKHELHNSGKMLECVKMEKKLTETELNNLIIKVKLENSQLQFANKKLQNLLVSQKEENDKIIADSKLYQEKIVNIEGELELCNQEIHCYHTIKRETEFLSKQLFLLQEINNLYKEKLKGMKEPTNPDIATDLMNNATFIEINDLKNKLESTCFQLDAAKSKVTELEQMLTNMKLEQKKHLEVVENVKSFHKDEMKVCEERLADHKKIAIMKDTYILELHKEKEMLSEKLSALEKKLNEASTIEKTSGNKSATVEEEESISLGICKKDTINSENKQS